MKNYSGKILRSTDSGAVAFLVRKGCLGGDGAWPGGGSPHRAERKFLQERRTKIGQNLQAP